MKKRKIRNINITDLNSEVTMKKFDRLSPENNGVNLIFMLDKYDEAFVSYVRYCMEMLKKAGVSEYKISVMTFDEMSNNDDINVMTRVLETSELENLIKIEEELPKGAKLCVSEKYYNVNHDFDLGSSIHAHEMINNYAD